MSIRLFFSPHWEVIKKPPLCPFWMVAGKQTKRRPPQDEKRLSQHAQRSRKCRKPLPGLRSLRFRMRLGSDREGAAGRPEAAGHPHGPGASLPFARCALLHGKKGPQKNSFWSPSRGESLFFFWDSLRVSLEGRGPVRREHPEAVLNPPRGSRITVN